MYFISYADILFWGLLSEKKLSYPSNFLPFIFVAIKTPVNRHVSSDFVLPTWNSVSKLFLVIT
jgi:hypothetical protein